MPCCRAPEHFFRQNQRITTFLHGFNSDADPFGGKVLEATPNACPGPASPVWRARQIPLSYGNLRAISLIWSSRRDCIPLYPSLTPLPQGAGPAWA
ncbi:protein of unknown function [Cupriavidus taiwanensis]|nr:protein of unknown function [Cupriavidus taiwanensis]